MFTENVMWLFGAYLAGSFATYYLFLGQNFKNATEGFLRHKTLDDGEIEILKWNANDE